jgi:hypothetical protein
MRLNLIAERTHPMGQIQSLVIASGSLPPSLATSNFPPPIDPDRMPITARHWQSLRSLEIVDEYARLVPIIDCERVIAEVERSLVSIADANQAIDLAERLTGSYPIRCLPNPEVYGATVTRVLAKFPVDLGEMAVDHIIENLRFLPAAADVASVLRNLAASRRIVAQRARMHLAEHERRARTAERRREVDTLSAEERQAHAAKVARRRHEREAPVAVVELIRNGRSQGFTSAEIVSQLPE